MGTLRDFELRSFDCDVFFETGTGVGYSLTYALASQCFERLYSVEIDPDAYQRAYDLFSPFRALTLINSDSLGALRTVLPDIASSCRVLFFLDAHFPGETSPSFPGYKADIASSLRLPLEDELLTIRELRGDCDDVIIVDDLRIYEDGPFDAGNMPEWAETLTKEQKSSAFVQRIFDKRKVGRSYRREGYLLIQR